MSHILIASYKHVIIITFTMLLIRLKAYDVRVHNNCLYVGTKRLHSHTNFGILIAFSM